MKKFCVTLSAVLLGGCASSGVSVKPEAMANSAKLRVSSIPDNNNFVTQADPRGCVSPRRLNELAVLGKRANMIRELSRLDMPLYDRRIPDAQQNEIYIPAGAEFSFQFNGVGIAGFSPGTTDGESGAIYSWCRKVVSFRPEVSANYEALYDYVGSAGQKTCGVTLFELIVDSSGQHRKQELSNYRVEHGYCK